MLHTYYCAPLVFTNLRTCTFGRQTGRAMIRTRKLPSTLQIAREGAKGRMMDNHCVGFNN